MEKVSSNFLLNALPDARKTAVEGDYMKDGLLYCGKCNTPKSHLVSSGDASALCPVKCKCERDKEKAEEELRQKNKKYLEVQMLKRYSLIEAKFANADFSNTEENKYNSRQIRLAKRYVEKFDQMLEKNQGLLFHGNVGTGKSRLSVCIANELIKKLHSVVSTSLVKIIQEAEYGRISEELVDALCTADLVILDDLGVEKTTNAAKEIIYYVIDCRSRSRKPLIVTTNLSVEEMKREQDLKDRRIYDRILETCYPVEFCGPSYRMKIAMTRNDEVKELLEGD